MTSTDKKNIIITVKYKQLPSENIIFTIIQIVQSGDSDEDNNLFFIFKCGMRCSRQSKTEKKKTLIIVLSKF